MINIYSVSILFSLIFLLAVIDLVRRNKLHERYSLLWIFFAIVVFVISSSNVFIEVLARSLGIIYAPSILFLLGLIYLLIYNLHITTVISQHTDKITRLTQEISLLKKRLGSGDHDTTTDSSN